MKTEGSVSVFCTCFIRDQPCPKQHFQEQTMSRKTLVLAVAALLLILEQSSPVHAWGAAHAGYTHVGPNGVYHAGETAVREPGGGASAYHAGYTSTSGYHAGYTTGSAYHAGYTTGGAYGAAGYHYSPTYSGTAYGGVRVGAAYVR
jgi:hypothetical protein